MLLHLWGSCRSSPSQSRSAWPARSYYPDQPLHTAECCSGSGQSSDMSAEGLKKEKKWNTQRKYAPYLFSSWLPLVTTHGEPVAPLPAAVVHWVPSVQPDPEPVLLVL